ncbi:MAG: iron-containing alcohol dehydrogenase [Lachnospiraceae bacterium]|jgi:alcohol dehydrogenase YqhD (iron-dependent ADH family)|nr:iron-containing alcohol dehydrogenase [Lachnospiraceae bacterium]MCH4030087.1 iron-containing alcohol dehydrogenase [Lachnospiraceae bacterium]MCH4070259.1 iron-containing alcohol dehydrogenase [Lachnospiraceae bacterium]MCH4107765.1 iron-containing alcohol dehydrogenase [Lachnospiraceae bacterium]MCI1301384.1 iron-containing alcohol dehydrogenase [Lachnospiraceae bacterium]
MIDSELCIPTRLVFGRGRYREIGKFVKGFSDKVLLLYGGGSIKKTGVYEGVTDSLREQGITWTELSGITSNPTLEIVQKGIKICREKSIGMLLAVGGGSVIDTAKAIACGRLYDGDVWDFFCGRKEVAKALPIAVVLTIPGTGSEVSGNAVLTNTINHEKRSAISDLLRPRLSILDPSLCTTIPKNQIGNGVYDMLSMFVQFAVNVMGVGGAIRDQKETALERIRALERFSKRLGLPQRLS